MFSPLKKHSRTGQIVEAVRAAIAEGRFSAGDRLPPERELAAMFGVSRTSVREAVKILSTYGQITSVQGDGLYVADQFTENVFDFLGHGSFITAGNFRPLYQARKVMETGSVMAALENIGKEDIDGLERLIALSAAESDVGRLQRLDADFHITIIQASRNPILTSLYTMLHKIMANGCRQGISAYPSGKKQVIADHRRIVKALRSGSRTRCCNAISRHLDASVQLFAKQFAAGMGQSAAETSMKNPPSGTDGGPGRLHEG